MIVGLGDIHFRDDKPYWIKICEDFLKWYNSWHFNNEDNDLILFGDLTDSSLLTGTVASYLDRFISSSRFKSIHICVGNHEKKKFNGVYQISYDFFRNRENVHIYEEMTEVNISGKNVLILPYYLGTNKYNLSMSDYYSNIPWNKNLSGKYDLVVGHFCGPDAQFPGSIDCVTNLDKINTKHLILGHIHTRYLSKERYIGSVFACKKNENDYTRAAIIIDDNNERFEEELPLFNEFLSVRYPEALPQSKALVPIYTVLNCASESVARAKYKNIFIRKVITDSTEAPLRRSVDMERQFSSIKEMDFKVLFNAFVDSQDPPLEKEVINKCNNLLNQHFTSLRKRN